MNVGVTAQFEIQVLNQILRLQMSSLLLYLLFKFVILLILFCEYFLKNLQIFDVGYFCRKKSYIVLLLTLTLILLISTDTKMVIKYIIKLFRVKITLTAITFTMTFFIINLSRSSQFF